MNQSVDMVKTAYTALSDKKGEEISIIDIRNVSVVADYFIIASGLNANQVQAMVDNVEAALEGKGYVCKQIEGYQTANWILMDYGDIIVHVFDRDNRLFYDLERIWRDGKTMQLEDLEV
ncbi:ribosome silencing factor [Clostridium sp. E02]|uniref:ribosome silencing factor n=1 Tax=Clostridium sp. E02 TaxID=2487134 RepID=UPI000F547B3E|nr:ribosome silencing factor [Clostridium sp. E02]